MKNKKPRDAGYKDVQLNSKGIASVKRREPTHRIPFDIWISSQLSVARFYGACIVNGKKYVFDPAAPRDADGKGKPDLVTYD